MLNETVKDYEATKNRRQVAFHDEDVTFGFALALFWNLRHTGASLPRAERTTV